MKKSVRERERERSTLTPKKRGISWVLSACFHPATNEIKTITLLYIARPTNNNIPVARAFFFFRISGQFFSFFILILISSHIFFFISFVFLIFTANFFAFDKWKEREKLFIFIINCYCCWVAKKTLWIEVGARCGQWVVWYDMEFITNSLMTL